ncbi:E3 ubiquitin-protein ligase AMFR isoform X2 [Plutella xylostella]|uniref:E3 ubiquitin-protein ligase AMFR isoform X2 n=1 Tax=Plutella xylostella TaxID=51655 RepID=UPI00203311EE|nr:E3 ubiquitin-protein ligase AMFR isoform X2 [Plutella xylostella]
MPGTLVDRLPLPNLKAYTAGSAALLSMAVYYALTATSQAGWRAGGGGAGAETAAAAGGAPEAAPAPALAPPGDRNLTEQVLDVATYMMQEPLCMWTLINASCCALALAGAGLQRLVFGRLRVAEAQRLKDKFWNYVFYKFIFVFGVLNVQYMDEVVLWCSWFTALGFLGIMAQLCKDRFEYLSLSPAAGGWARARLLALLLLLACAAAALLAVAAVYGLPAGWHTFAFMAAECVLVLVSCLHSLARLALQAADADAAAAPVYYTHLVFDMIALLVELVDALHMVLAHNMALSAGALVLLLQLRSLLARLAARAARHARYAALRALTMHHYPVVPGEGDTCAICWDAMKDARQLPCKHLFHSSCLTVWLQQDPSCPTCRRALLPPAPPAAPAAPPQGPRNTTIHFNRMTSSRYVSWLPSFSVEVTRAPPPPPRAQIDAMARQVQAMFPAHSLAQLARDLLATRSAALTATNILEGRLPPEEEPSFPDPPPESAPPAPATVAAPVVEPEPEIDEEDDKPVEVQFSSSSHERESLLQRRKRQLVAEARRRYLARRPPAPAPATPAAPAPGPAS